MKKFDFLLPSDVNPRRLQWKFLYAVSEKGKEIRKVPSKLKGKRISALRSMRGQQDWKIGEWYEAPRMGKIGEWYEAPRMGTYGGVLLCHNGFHSSPNIRSAWYYVQGPILALVEWDGDTQKTDSTQGWGWQNFNAKRCSRRMRVVKAWVVTNALVMAIQTTPRRQLDRNTWHYIYTETNDPLKVVATLPEVTHRRKLQPPPITELPLFEKRK